MTKNRETHGKTVRVGRSELKHCEMSSSYRVFYLMKLEQKER